MAKTIKDAVTVIFKGIEREFTREVHGDDFEKTAATFIESNGGEIKGEAKSDAEVV